MGEFLIMTHAKSFRRRVHLALLVAGTVLMGTAAASAQGTVAQREACEADAFKFCSEFIPFVHAIENCLSKNIRRLTPACQVQMRGGAPVSRRR